MCAIKKHFFVVLDFFTLGGILQCFDCFVMLF